MDRSTPPVISKSGKSSASKVESKLDDLGFLEIASGADPIVDIIAIHGLQGHRLKTWTTEDGVCWLRDLLPSDLPNVRILSYGYDADTHSRECVSTQTLGRHADSFATALSRERKDAPRRPIIFVAHDVGGIILKSALVICHNQNLDSSGGLRDILVSTHGILFFGTPHFGLEGITYLETINRLASVYMQTTDVILKDLREHSSELEDIQRLYAVASEKISSIFFCEEYATSGIGNRGEVNVPSRSAVIAGDRNATTVFLHSNHRNLVRFSFKTNDNYKTIQYYLKIHIDNAPAAVHQKWVTENDCRNVAKGKSASEQVTMPKPCPGPSRTYIERKEIERLITEKLLRASHVKRQPRCILYGLGGVGKTQLATKWIQDHESSFSRVIFVDASSQSQMEADLERSIRSLGSEYNSMTWKDAVAYLDGKENGWLLFFDNADLPDLNIRPYLPSNIHGTVLITTRNSRFNQYAPDGAVPIGNLEEKEAVSLLHTIANIEPMSDIKSLEIVHELGMLALAITQAGAYIGTTRRIDTYLDTFRRHRDQILRRKQDIDAEYGFSTYAAFDLFFNKLPGRTQELLKLCAFLHYSLIPKCLFERSIASGFSTYIVRDTLPPPESDQPFVSNLQEIFGSTWNEVEFQNIIDSASHASSLNVSTDGLFYTFHPLLQMYVKDRLDQEENQRYMRMTMQLLLGAIRPVKDSNAWFWQLLPHVDSIPRSIQSENVAHALAFHELYNSLGNWKACRELLETVVSQHDQTGTRDEDTLFILSRLADALRANYQLNEAEKLEREVLASRLESLGRRHPDSLSAMGNLAETLSISAQLDEAERMEREILSLRLEIFGKRNIDTIKAIRNLAATLWRRAQFDEAEKMDREVLALRLEILGQQHPDTIFAVSNLAVILSSLGQLDEAEKMERDVLARRLETLGERHPGTIVAMNNLAITLHDRGQLDEAEKMRREVLASRLEILGKRHPYTLSAISGLANTLCQRGQLDEAEKMDREVLLLSREILGQRHLDTISAMSSLATTLRSLGQLDEAEKMGREVVNLRREILGQRNLATIAAVANLACTLRRRCQVDQAETMDREVLALRVAILGQRHTDTISAMSSLAYTLWGSRKLEEAERMEREVLALRLELNGKRHLDTISAMHDLAGILCDYGQVKEAEEMKREVLALRVEILGRRHLDTISAMRSLAISLSKRGQLEEAENMCREVLALRVEILGQHHLDTISAKSDLVSILLKRGLFDEAEQMDREVVVLRLKILGQRHLDTILAMSDLASTLHQRGQLDEAERLNRNVFALRLEILGQRHSDTISAMSHLAATLQKRGQSDEAERLQREVLALRLDIFGQRHVDTISAMSDLTCTLYWRGQLEETERIEREILALRLEILGKQHPDTISTVNNLAATLRGRGQHEEATKLEQELLSL